MKKSLFAVLLSIAVYSQVSFARNGDHPGQIHNDAALVTASSSKKNVFYVEGGNLTVTKLLPDDTDGSPHQKWQAQLTNGVYVTFIYNSDMGDRVPLKVGDKFGAGGQYIPTGRSGILHWLHEDPKQKRPDGYVYVNGVIYGETAPH